MPVKQRVVEHIIPKKLALIDRVWMRQESFGDIQAWVIRGLVARMTQNTAEHSEAAAQGSFLHHGLER